MNESIQVFSIAMIISGVRLGQHAVHCDRVGGDKYEEAQYMKVAVGSKRNLRARYFRSLLLSRTA